MGPQAGQICRRCGTRFTVCEGGGFVFDELHCDACGADTSVSHRDMGEIHLRYVKGLDRPYAIVRAELDRAIQEEHPGEPLGEAAYHAAVEATLEPCACGGRFRYGAPPRCPGCRSTAEAWDEDPSAGMVIYD